MKKIFDLVITCPEDTKEALSQELKELGIDDLRPYYKAIRVVVDEELFYKLHLNLRTASRVFWMIEKFSAYTAEQFEKKIKQIAWEDYFSPSRSIKCEVIKMDQTFSRLRPQELSKMLRLGINERFIAQGAEAPKFEMKEPHLEIHAIFAKNVCFINFDTSRKALHKRGYRKHDHPAPLKETLAASILKTLNYEGKETFVDLMTGSGTLVIEAAQMALNKAPLIHRKKDEFGFEHLKIFNREMYKDIQEEIRGRKDIAPKFPILANDIDKGHVEKARDNALAARVEKFIIFTAMDFRKFECPDYPNGLVVANLPYGERLSDFKKLEELYRDFGFYIKNEFHGWRAGIFCAKDAPWAKLGLKPAKKWKFLNGDIECFLFLFELYKGSKKEGK